MQDEPIQFGVVAASRAQRSAAGFTLPVRGVRKTAGSAETASVRDAAFADFSRVDTGSPSSMTAKISIRQISPTATQSLIADIATQLEALDSQRRQLARLLESVDLKTTV
jgi:hypothetical protein